ncbi:hypothetical protein C353_02803, partial [Cryptococcus neoformans AD1-83a]
MASPALSVDSPLGNASTASSLCETFEQLGASTPTAKTMSTRDQPMAEAEEPCSTLAAAPNDHVSKAKRKHNQADGDDSRDKGYYRNDDGGYDSDDNYRYEKTPEPPSDHREQCYWCGSSHSNDCLFADWVARHHKI